MPEECPHDIRIMDALAREEKRKRSKAYHAAWYQTNRQQERIKQKQWREVNQERKKEADKIWYTANRERIKPDRQAYRDAHKELRKTYDRTRYEANREERNKQSKAYYKANRERIQARQKVYLRENPCQKLAATHRNTVGTLLRRRGINKSRKTTELLGCDIFGLVAWLEVQFRQGMTWENYGPVWHVDHIRPCASFDLNDSKQQRRCFHWTNLQPLFASENLSKHDKWHN